MKHRKHSQWMALAGLMATTLLAAGLFFQLMPGNTTLESAEAALSTTQNTNAWVPDSSISAMALGPDGNLYIGGSFENIGPHYGYMLQVTQSAGTHVAATPKVDGPIYSIIEDGSGGYFIGGQFTKVGTTSRENLARIKSDGTLDTAFTVTANSVIYDLHLDGTDLYAVGSFSTIGGVGRNKVAKIDTTNSTVDGTFTPGIINSTVRAIEVDGTRAYIGGQFTTVASNGRKGFAALLKTNGSLDGTFPSNMGPNGGSNFVYDMEFSGTDLYVVGNFSAFQLSIRNGGAMIDTSSDTLGAWDPHFNAFANVFDVEVDGSTIFLGGSFSSLNNGAASRQNIASTDTAGTANAFNPGASSTVYMLDVSGTDLYVAGFFQTINSTTRNRLAKINKSTGAVDSWNPNPNGGLNTVLASGSNVVFSGNAFSHNGVARTYLAAIDPDTGQPTTFAPDIDGTVNAITFDGNTMYIGGSFTDIGGTTRNNAASFDTNLTLTTWNPNVSDTVNDIVIDSTRVFLGGSFSQVGGNSHDYLAITNKTDGTVDAWDANFDDTVIDLLLDGTNLYVAGDFTDVDVASRNRIAAFDVSGATPAIDNTFNPNADDTVKTMILDGSDLYIGGSFNDIGGSTREYLAKVSKTTGAVDAGWNPTANGTVNQMAFGNSSADIIVAGNFSAIASEGREGLAILGKTTATASSFDPDPQSMEVIAVDDTNETFYVGGSFATLGGASWHNFAMYGDGQPPAPPVCGNNVIEGAEVCDGTSLAGETCFSQGFHIGTLTCNASCTGYATSQCALIPDSTPPSTTIETGIPVTNGLTRIIRRGPYGNMYVAGDFDTIGMDYGLFLGASLDSGNPRTDLERVAGPNGTLQDIISDGAGGWYIAGSFSHVQGTQQEYVARIDSDGTLNTTFVPDVNGIVNAMVKDGNTLYIAGLFTDVNGSTRNRVAAVNATDGTLLSWYPTQGANTTVRDITLDGDYIYAVGNFTSFANTTRNRIAKVHKTTAALDAWNPNLNSSAFTIEIDGTDVYVGGAFTTVNGGTGRDYVAAFTTSSATASAWNPDPNNVVRSIAPTATHVYLGGNFTDINAGTTRNRLAQVDRTTAVATAFDANVDSSVFDVEVDGSTVYLSGTFDSVGGSTRRYVASVDGTTGAVSSWDPAANKDIYKLYKDTSHMMMGGTAYSLNVVERNKVASYNPIDKTINAWNPNPNGEVYAIGFSGQTVYLGGDFTDVNSGTTRNRLAAFDNSTGTATSWDPNVNSTVRTILVDGGTMYIGGSFTDVNGGTSRDRLASLNISDGMDAGLNLDVNSDIYDLAKDGDDLYLAGAFTDIGGSTRNRLASIDVTGPTLNSWDPNANAIAFAVEVANDIVYVGGTFTTIGGTTRNYIASLDNDASSTLRSWNPNADNQVNTISILGNDLYVAGLFDNIAGGARHRLAAIDRFSGSLEAWNPVSDFIGAVEDYQLFVEDSVAYLAGDFEGVDGDSRHNLAQFGIPAAPELCGNSIIDTGEACDDGNTTAGDGCSASCQNEIGTNVVVENDPGSIGGRITSTGTTPDTTPEPEPTPEVDLTGLPTGMPPMGDFPPVPTPPPGLNMDDLFSSAPDAFDLDADVDVEDIISLDNGLLFPSGGEIDGASPIATGQNLLDMIECVREGKVHRIVVDVPNAFEDIDGHPLERYIEALRLYGVIQGFDGGTRFAPERPITRAEFVKVVLLIFCYDIDEQEDVLADPYSDVDENAWYARYIQTATREGIVNGYLPFNEEGEYFYDDGWLFFETYEGEVRLVPEEERLAIEATIKFIPNGPVGRVEALKIFLNASMRNLDTDLRAMFTDTEQGRWYSKFINYAILRDLMAGFEDGTFKPLEPMTRAEMTQMVMNYIWKDDGGISVRSGKADAESLQ